jgi:hypothetical protein
MNVLKMIFIEFWIRINNDDQFEEIGMIYKIFIGHLNSI